MTQSYKEIGRIADGEEDGGMFHGREIVAQDTEK